MRVASEQASGEKYRSMMPPGPQVRCRGPMVDFYTVSHNINRVKEFLAKWYKKIKGRERPRSRLRREAGAGHAPISRKSRWGRRSTCFARVVSRPPRWMI